MAEPPTWYRIACTCRDGPRIRNQLGRSDANHMVCVKCGARLEAFDPDEPRISQTQVTGVSLRGAMIVISRTFAKTGSMPKGIERSTDVKALQDRIAELEASEKQRIESEDLLKKKIGLLEAENRRLRNDVLDSEKTAAHCRNEVERQKSVDVRGAMKEISDYFCDIYYAPDKKDSLEKLGGFIRNRTEMAMMNLEGRGIEIVSEVPREKLSGSAEVIGKVPTTDWTLNNKVALVDSFGCRFRNDLFPPIQGAVRIYSSGRVPEGGPEGPE